MLESRRRAVDGGEISARVMGRVDESDVVIACQHAMRLVLYGRTSSNSDILAQIKKALTIDSLSTDNPCTPPGWIYPPTFALGQFRHRILTLIARLVGVIVGDESPVRDVSVG